MNVTVVWGKLRRGRWDEYKKFYMESVVPATQRAKGCTERQLFRSNDDPDERMSISFGDSRADMDAYDRSGDRQQVSRRA